MKTRDLLGWSCLCLSATMLQAAETNDTELLKRQLREVTEKFEKSLLEQRQMIESLRKQIEAMEQQRAATPRTNQITPAVQPAAALALAQPAVSAPPESSMLTNQAWSPSQPLTLARAGSAYMNVSFGALVDAGWSDRKSTRLNSSHVSESR